MRTIQSLYAGIYKIRDNCEKISNNPLKITLGIRQGYPLLTLLPSTYTDKVIWNWKKEITFTMGNILVNTLLFAYVQATPVTSEDDLQPIHKFSIVGTK
jgi:hypothetical protein